MSTKKLTEKEYWEKYWEKYKEAFEIKRTKRGLLVNEILDIFDKYLPVNENYHALEIGGAPGQYLIYMAKNFKYKVHSLDYSKTGNKQTEKNFKSSDLKIKIYEKDFFSEYLDTSIPNFDVVYSLGFIEHFDNLNEVVKRHVQLLKPGGILLLGIPNLRGIYRVFLSQTAPNHLFVHNLNTMKLSNWDLFENELKLKKLFRNYLGGFEPIVMKKIEKRKSWILFLNFIVKGLMVIFSFRFSFLRKFNSRYWSGYAIGIYKKT